jgi:hypothetical protein
MPEVSSKGSVTTVVSMGTKAPGVGKRIAARNPVVGGKIITTTSLQITSQETIAPVDLTVNATIVRLSVIGKRIAERRGEIRAMVAITKLSLR